MTIKYKVKHRSGYDDSLVGFTDCGMAASIHIDRTHYATEWNEKHGMKPVETVTADTGERFTIWTGKDLACAVPIEEGR